jgi:flavoprotein
MKLKHLADDAVSQIQQAVSAPLTQQETAEISKIIADTLARVVSQTSKQHTAAAVICCGPEADIAHKIAEEADRAQQALIANLVAMR